MVKSQPGSSSSRGGSISGGGGGGGSSALDHITTIKGLKETPQQIALRALRSITKSITEHAMIEDIPSDLLFGENIDLHRWSMILKDTAMEELSKQKESGKKFVLDTSATTIQGMFKTFWTKYESTLGLLYLNIANSKQVTDYGLTIVAHNSAEMRSLDISGCTNITDAALREVALHCPKLTSLNISSCHNIKGSGLVAIADCCPYVSKLNISKCGNLENWSLQKLFRKTTHLEELIVSYLREITDEELRVMAEHAHDFMHLEAIECRNVTDQAILSITANCKDLDYVDLTRTEFTSRVSDVTLMALGQKCHSLRTLKVNNCDGITDVGLGWLTEGCKVIETLEFSGCNKITDAGLRVLGSTCRSLTAIDISQAKSVSDIGISTLSRGCRQLKIVKIPGIFFLADPRLSTPNGNGKPELWEELIGIPCMTAFCPNIESLDLTGCFRLNKALAQSLPMLKSLRVLVLKGLNQAVPASLIAVAKGCPTLEELTLTDTGKAVTNEVLVALQQYCRDLKILIACRCNEIKGAGIKAISLMEKLEKLDLSGCSHLTDSSLVHLSAIGTLPKLTHLELTNMPKITDSFVAWFAMKDHILIHLSVRSTMISQRALNSVKDRFPNSDLLINANFVGYWPKFRVFDRMMVGHYQRVIEGLVKIQSFYRKHCAIVRVQFIRQHNTLIAAHALLHRLARGFMARRRVAKIRKQKYLEHTSAIVITSIFRIIIPKKKLKKLRYQQYMKMVNAKALIIQCAYRSYLARLVIARKKQAKIDRYNYKIRCCTKIQSIGRMYLANCYVYKVREFRKAMERLSQRKAIVIQRYYRGYCGRKVTRFYQDLIERTKILRDKCARKIQYRYRRYRTLCIIVKRQQLKKKRWEMAIKIQSVMRGALARLHVAIIQMEHITTRRRNAVILIQCRYRVYQARCRFFQKIKERRRLKKIQNDAATMINRCCRMKLAWKKMMQKRREYLQRMKEDAQRLIDAATKIQALIRRFLGRCKYLRKIKEVKGKWKELYDEKKKKRFFYNKLTGEIRWRIPQDLLDLIPHPQCDNCTMIEAIIECQVCNEIFCGECFHKVHAGGRRKEHNYRAMYDFYGKRLDYGDGIFPCQWPTEVIQDEIQGWMLRIAPHRQPYRIYKASGWEEYHFSEEEVLQSQPQSILRKNFNQERVHNSMRNAMPKMFYFNRKTFQSTYDLPPEVAAEQYQESIVANDLVLPRSAAYSSGGAMGSNGAFGSTGGPAVFSETYYGNSARAGTASGSNGYYPPYPPYSAGFAGSMPGTAGSSMPGTAGAEGQDYSQLGYYDSEGNWVWYNNNFNNAQNFDSTYGNTPYTANNYPTTPFSQTTAGDAFGQSPYSMYPYDTPGSAPESAGIAANGYYNDPNYANYGGYDQNGGYYDQFGGYYDANGYYYPPATADGAPSTPYKDNSGVPESARSSGGGSSNIYGTQGSFASNATPRRAARRAGYPSKSPMSTIPHASMDEASLENDDSDDESSSASSSIVRGKKSQNALPPIRKGSNGQAPPARRRSVSFEDERSSQDFRQRTSSFEVASSQSDGYDSSIMRTTELDNTSQDGYVASDGQKYNFSHNEDDEDEYEE